MVSGTKKSTAIPSPKQKSISPQTLFIEKQLPSILFYAVRELFDAFYIRLFYLRKKLLFLLQCLLFLLIQPVCLLKAVDQIRSHINHLGHCILVLYIDQLGHTILDHQDSTWTHLGAHSATAFVFLL